MKVAPDLDDSQVETIAELAVKHSVDGLVATNTTVSREEIAGHRHAGELGGLSGRPLFERSTGILRKLAALLGGRVPLIGVGGILSGEDAHAKIAAGASLVQVYTGFIYRGPGLIGEARRALYHMPRGRFAALVVRPFTLSYPAGRAYACGVAMLDFLQREKPYRGNRQKTSRLWRRLALGCH